MVALTHRSLEEITPNAEVHLRESGSDSQVCQQTHSEPDFGQDPIHCLPPPPHLPQHYGSLWWLQVYDY